MITRRIVRWLDERLRFASIGRKALAKVFPDHWSFMLGEIAVYSFMLLVLTGTYLAFFYSSGSSDTVYHGHYAPLQGGHASEAYVSTIHLSWDVRFGLLMRQTHHWLALIFVGAIVLHLGRIFLTGAFRKPRELNWVIGVTLLILAIVNGFAGYSLPDDLLSGIGLRVAFWIMASIPLVGQWVVFFVFGSEYLGHQIDHRLYIAHVFIIPALLAVLITAHMVILIKQKHSQFPGPGRNEHNVVGSRLYPTYAIRSMALFCGVTGISFLLGGLAQINPIWLYGPNEPTSTTAPAQPDWYVGWVDGALRIYPPFEPTLFGYRLPALFLPGVVMPALTFGILYAWPFLEPRFTKDRAPHQLLNRVRDHPVRVAFFAAGCAFYLDLLVAFAADVISRYTHMPIGTLYAVLRIFAFAGPILGFVGGFYLTRGLKRSGAEGFTTLGLAGVRNGLGDDDDSRAGVPPSERVAEEHGMPAEIVLHRGQT